LRLSRLRGGQPSPPAGSGRVAGPASGGVAGHARRTPRERDLRSRRAVRRRDLIPAGGSGRSLCTVLRHVESVSTLTPSPEPSPAPAPAAPPVAVLPAPGAHPSLSLVIPAYNEERRLGPTLARVFEYFASRPYTTEVVIVSDGSADGTSRVAGEA